MLKPGFRSNNCLERNEKIIVKYIEKNYDVTQWDKITISKDNQKMTANGITINSFSVMPILTCKNCRFCSKKCYAKRMCQRYKNCKASYMRNTYFMIRYPYFVYTCLKEELKNKNVFRFNVAGDIFSKMYLVLINRIAAENKNCKIIVFTKNYDLINDYYKKHKKPENLKLMLSDWTTENGEKQHFENIHNLPVTDIIPKNTIHFFKSNERLCTGNCYNCFSNCQGCFNLKNGEKLYFNEH